MRANLPIFFKKEQVPKNNAFQYLLPSQLTNTKQMQGKQTHLSLTKQTTRCDTVQRYIITATTMQGIIVSLKSKGNTLLS